MSSSTAWRKLSSPIWTNEVKDFIEVYRCRGCRIQFTYRRSFRDEGRLASSLVLRRALSSGEGTFEGKRVLTAVRAEAAKRFDIQVGGTCDKQVFYKPPT